MARTREELEALREVWPRPSVHLNVDLDHYLTVNDSFAVNEASAAGEARDAAIRPYVVTLSDGDEPVGMLIGRLETGRLALALDAAARHVLARTRLLDRVKAIWRRRVRPRD